MALLGQQPTIGQLVHQLRQPLFITGLDKTSFSNGIIAKLDLANYLSITELSSRQHDL